MGVLLLLAADCGELPDFGENEPEAAPALPATAAPGDEIVLVVGGPGAGAWSAEEAHGTLIEARLGANLPRHVVVPGEAIVVQRVSLGAWDGGAFALTVLEGTTDFLTLTLEVDPTAAGTPVLGTYDARWSNDTPLLTYVEDGTWTWVYTDEDGGTGHLPTLLMASWGRPVDIEGLWDERSGTIQTHDHAWVAFEGEYEGTHPLFQVVTANGMIGPLEDASVLLSPMAVDFDTAGGTLPRERVLDEHPWVLAAAWAEAEREGLVAADGGHGDYAMGAPDDYVFVDYEVSGGARVAFEVEVGGVWWSSLNDHGTSGLTDATVSGVGRTCVELPPGADAADLTGLQVRSHGGAGTVGARWFRYEADLTPVAFEASADIPVEDGATASLP